MRARSLSQPSTPVRPACPPGFFALFSIAVLSAFLAATPASAQSERAIELTENAASLIAEQDFETAIREADKAIEEDENYWRAWFERGRALAMSGRMEEGKESLLRSTELNPGNADAHRMAALAAQNVEEYDLAWDQAIRAYLAGANPQTVFGGLSADSPEPPDFNERVNAWRVYVAGIDTRELLAAAQSPDNTRGGAAGVQEALVEIQPDLQRLQQVVARALSDSRVFGLVQDPERAQYLFTIAPEELYPDQSSGAMSSQETGRRSRPSMRGYLRLYNLESEEPIFFQSVLFRDLSASGQVAAAVEQVINQMEAWRSEQQQ